MRKPVLYACYVKMFIMRSRYWHLSASIPGISAQNAAIAVNVLKSVRMMP